MRRTAIVLLIIAAFLVGSIAVGNSHADQTATLTVDAATQNFPSVHVGDTVQVNINIINVQNLWGWDIEGLSFNPGILKLTGVSEGQFLQSVSQTIFMWPSTDSVRIDRDGYVKELSCVLFEKSGANGTGVLFTLTFQVLSLGTSPIMFNQTQMLNPAAANTNGLGTAESEISVNAVNANVVVGTPSNSSPAPSSSPSTAAPSQTPQNTNPASSPTSSPAIPEFSTWILLAALMLGATAAVLFVGKKAGRLQK